MSNRLFQSVVHKMGESIERTIGVLDENGIIVACSDYIKLGNACKTAYDEISFMMDTAVIDGYTYRPIGPKMKNEYIAFVEGDDEFASGTAAILAVALENIKTFYDEKYDKTIFIKNIILDNILPADVYVKSKELHFTENIPLVVYLVRFNGRADIVPFDIVQNMFSDKNKDYVIGIGDNDIALIKNVQSIERKDIEKTAKQISDTVSSEFYTNVSVGIGTVVDNVKDLARSYKEAQIALDVGKVFDTDKNIVSYENLGIGRLIYHLPTTLCEMFLNEVLRKGSLDTLDRETLLTIQCFFENNLNVSETSRKLFIHRNTLVYRLEKIRRLTGLDLREFEHAITFKVALMVKKYLASKKLSTR